MRKDTAKKEAAGAYRDRIAMLFAIVTLAIAATVFLIAEGTQALMPGSLASAHGTIDTCESCHTNSGTGKLSWLGGLAAGDRHADSKACLTCHKMPETAFNAHGASMGSILESTRRLEEAARQSTPPLSARAQSHLFPAETVARKLYCATCHQEHQGAGFDLNEISDAQCRACHVVKFDSFDGKHPDFKGYPFGRRTRIIYDHAGHFAKHYPEVAKKEPGKRIPSTCSACHNSQDDKRLMAVAPFDQTCSQCHLDQITGKERASGPKGIAFLTIPGLDVQTLKAKNAAIGEWPETSEATLSPFMKIMIGRTEQGRALLKSIDRLNLEDLTSASDDQIKSVTDLVWEIKGLFYALLKGKASGVLGDLKVGGGDRPSAIRVADLTASMPRDAIAGAQQAWLPNLAVEMARRPVGASQTSNGWSAVVTGPGGTLSAASQERAGSSSMSDNMQPISRDASAKTGTTDASTGVDAVPAGNPSNKDVNAAANDNRTARFDIRDPPVCLASLFGACLVFKEKNDNPGTAASDGGAQVPATGVPPGRMNAGVRYAQNTVSRDGPVESGSESHPGGEQIDPAVEARWPLPSGTPRSIESQNKDAKEAAQPAASEKAGAAATPVPGNAKKAQVAPAAGLAEDAGKGRGGDGAPDASSHTALSGDQTDELLFPSEEEQREINSRRKGGGPLARAVDVNATASSSSALDAAGAAAAATPALHAGAPHDNTIASEVDPESWAEYGGWYRQDHVIFYRPVGHKDKFIYAWLMLTGSASAKGDASPAAAVFNSLTSKDAQGSCTKCHSVDDVDGERRLVNFAPASKATKQGRFTIFIHEPHFGIVDHEGDAKESRGCLACHSLAKNEPKSSAASDGASAAGAASDSAAEPAANIALSRASGAARGVTAENPDADKAAGPYLKSYEQGDPRTFSSGFAPVNKETCQACHNSTQARQDCLTCHTYHVNGVTATILSTKNPM